MFADDPIWTWTGSSSVTISSQSNADSSYACDTLDGSIIISSVTGVITIGNVEQINGAITAEGASGFTKLIAPDLDMVKGALTLDGLDSLTTLIMNALSRVSSGLTISDNSRLESLDFEELEEVDGQLILTGCFKGLVADCITYAGVTDDGVSLPSLDQVRGQTAIRGASSMSCNAPNGLRSDGAFRDGYSCLAGSMDNSLSAGAQGGIAVCVIVGVLLLLLLLGYMLRQRRQRKNGRGRSDATPSPALLADEKPPSSQYKSVPSDEPQRFFISLIFLASGSSQDTRASQSDWAATSFVRWKVGP